jgi:hypothetical protein
MPINVTDALHNILEHAETLDMNNGDYIRVANALRDAFLAGPAGTPVRPRHRFVVDRRIKITVRNRGIPYTLELVRQTRTDGGRDRPDSIECEYRLDGADRLLFARTHFNNIVNNFLWLHKPKTVSIESDIGKCVVSYARVYKDNLKEIDDLKTRLAIPGLDDSTQEELRQYLSETSHFTYTDFVSEVQLRIPDTENLYIL